MRTFILVVAIAAAACGQSEAEKQAEAFAKAAEDVAKAAETAANAGTAAASTDMAKAMEGVAAAFSGKGADGKPVQPIAFQTLQTHLPKVSGWEMSEPQGQRMTMPMPF